MIYDNKTEIAHESVSTNFLPHHSQRSSMEKWSRNTSRVVTARVYYVLGGLNIPLYFNQFSGYDSAI